MTNNAAGGPVQPKSIATQQGQLAPAQPQAQAQSGYYSAGNPFSVAPTAGDAFAESDMRDDREVRDRFGSGGGDGMRRALDTV